MSQTQPSLFSPSSLVIQIDEFEPSFLKKVHTGIDNGADTIRFAALSPDRVFSFLTSNPHKLPNVIEGMDRVHSLEKRRRARLETFKRSMKCACCGREGSIFFVERQRNEQETVMHLNLYSCDSSGSLVLMTVDHIFPDSVGGKFHSSNFQTMCRPCNMKKQHLMTAFDIELVRAKPSQYAKEWVPVQAIHLILDLQQALIQTDDKVKLRELNKLYDNLRKQLKPDVNKGLIKRYRMLFNLIMKGQTYAQAIQNKPEQSTTPFVHKLRKFGRVVTVETAAAYHRIAASYKRIFS